jgi:hypothetical protein
MRTTWISRGEAGPRVLPECVYAELGYSNIRLRDDAATASATIASPSRGPEGSISPAFAAKILGETQQLEQEGSGTSQRAQGASSPPGAGPVSISGRRANGRSRRRDATRDGLGGDGQGAALGGDREARREEIHTRMARRPRSSRIVTDRRALEGEGKSHA